MREGLEQELMNNDELSDVLQYARTSAMARLLVENGANVYTWIGNGQVALDEMVKHFPILEFLQEAREQIPVELAAIFVKYNIHTTPEDTDIIVTAPDIPRYYASDWNLLRHLIFHGLFPLIPHNEKYRTVIEHLFFHRYNQETAVIAATGDPDETLGAILNTCSLFMFKSVNVWKKEGEQNPYSFPLLLFAPDAVYKQSKRAKTSMSMFRTSNNQFIYSRPSAANYLPITRYGEGMSKGLYNIGPYEPSRHCGTFYYFEMESTTFLFYKNALMARDKQDAAKKLGIVEIQTEQGRFDLERYWTVEFPTSSPHSFMLTANQFRANFPRGFSSFYAFDDNMQLDRTFYGGFPYYAQQDDLDQPICKAAKSQGYDVILLTHMIGSRQVVYEVLDTRLREESFANLRFLVEPADK